MLKSICSKNTNICIIDHSIYFLENIDSTMIDEMISWGIFLASKRHKLKSVGLILGNMLKIAKINPRIDL